MLLQDAVDSISDGFAIHDREDCFVMCNETYRRLHHRGPELMVPGARFEDLLRVNVAEGRSLMPQGLRKSGLPNDCAHTKNSKAHWRIS